MKNLLFSLCLLLAFGAAAQSKQLPAYHAGALPGSEQTLLYAGIGAAGYEVGPAQIPSGLVLSAGFMSRYGTLAIHGAGGYNSRANPGDISTRYYFFEGGVGAFVSRDFAVTAGISYHGRRDGRNGGFGLVLRPVLQLVPLTRNKNLNLMVTAAMSFTDEFMSFSGLMGLSYTIRK